MLFIFQEQVLSYVNNGMYNRPSMFAVLSYIAQGQLLSVNVIEQFFGSSGPTKHRKELQGTENSAKNYKVLQGTTRYYKELQGTTRNYKILQTKYKVAENTTRNYKVLLNQG